jgi:hypothetical protein
MAITIDQNYINEIKSALGYPLVEGFEWENNSSTEDYIKNYVLSRVFRTYFTYFPIRIETNHSVSGQFEIDYPADPMVKRVLRHFFNFKNWSMLQNISPFMLQTMVIGRGTYSGGYDMSRMQQSMSDMTTYESLVDFTRALQIDDRPQERKVYGLLSTPGDITLQWLKVSEDFNDIIYSHVDNAIKLAKGFLMQDAARIRSQVTVNSKATLESSVIKADGDRYVEEVENEWKNRGFASGSKG